MNYFYAETTISQVSSNVASLSAQADRLQSLLADFDIGDVGRPVDGHGTGSGVAGDGSGRPT